MDKEKLLDALDNEKNESLINYTSQKLKEETNEILGELKLEESDIMRLTEKLKNYRYVDELNMLDEGRYIRWINLKITSDFSLNTGAILCKIQFHDNGAYLLCKTYTKKCFNLKFEEALVFMKLNNEELILLSALDHLSK